MVNIRDQLNKTGKCCIPINASNTIYLNVIRVYPMPPQVQDQDVPIFTERKFPILPTEWDITMQQILPYIDGFRHVAKIAVEAGVEICLVKAFIQNMVYYGVVTLIPIFMYSNVYTPTPKLNELAENNRLQEECTKYVARQGCHKPFFRSIFMLYCQLTPETNVKTLCVRHNPRAMGIDERKLIQFGLMKGIIRQLQKYPIHLSSDSAVKDKTLLKYFNGNYSFEEICCKTDTMPIMSEKHVPHYITVEGLRFAEGFDPESIRSALSYQPQPYDVFVVTYPKCGTTWMMQIVLLILHEGQLPESTEEYFACTPYLEMLGAEAVDKMPRPSPIRSHLPFDMIPFANHAKYIYVARNPKDCCISLYHHTKMFPSYGFSRGSFDDFFKVFLKGETDYNDYFDHLLSWYEHKDDENIFFITYEQLKDDTKGAVLQIADFLGKQYGKLLREKPKLLEKILHYSSYDFMQQDTFELWKEALKIAPEALSDANLPPGLLSWAESAVDCHYGQHPYGQKRYGNHLDIPQVSVRDLMRRTSLFDWDTTLKPVQEQKLKKKILEKTRNSQVMELWREEELMSSLTV